MSLLIKTDGVKRWIFDYRFNGKRNTLIDRLLRSEKCEVTVAGSLLPSPDEDTTSPLTGRIVSWEIFPLSFREFLDGKSIESDGPLRSSSD